VKKALIILQFCEADRDTAMSLARLIADLEQSKSEYADFMFSSTYGVAHDPEIVDYVKSKFDVLLHTCKNDVRGWPQGPGNQVQELFYHLFIGTRDKGWTYPYAHLIEPDAVPLSRDWIRKLYEEWHENGHPQKFMGAWMATSAFDCKVAHLNGNMMFDPSYLRENKFWRWLTACSWDTGFSTSIIPNAKASRQMWNEYRMGTIHNRCHPTELKEKLFMKQMNTDPNHPLYNQELSIVYHHGCKLPQAIDIVRATLLQ
jgi:hypothetical protein